MMSTCVNFHLHHQQPRSVWFFLPSLDPFVTSTVTPRYLVKMELIASVLYFSFLGLSQLSTPEHCELLR